MLHPYGNKIWVSKGSVCNLFILRLRSHLKFPNIYCNNYP